MMIAIPFIGVEVTNTTNAYGLQNIFWFGLSGCTSVEDFNTASANKSPIRCRTNATKNAWISETGYSFMMYELSQSSRYRNGYRHTRLYHPLLYLKVADLRTPSTSVDGNPLYGSSHVVKEIKSPRCHEAEKIADYTSDDGYTFNIPEGYMPRTRCEKGTCCWEAHELCQDFDERCPWRESEMTMVTFTPPACGKGTPCQNFYVTAIYLTRYKTETESTFSLLQTTFIVVLLGGGAMLFSKDTEVLVISPIEKMVSIVKQLADDPLKKPEVAEEEDNFRIAKKKGSGGGHLDTAMLESTILKIGNLLQIGFGEVGTQIIGKNMASHDGELNIMMPGRKVVGVFGFCDVKDFMETTDCLLEEVMVFVNKLARIVHLCVYEWGGAANKNSGDTFFVTWMVNDAEQVRKILASGDYENNEKLSELADKALISFLKIGVELRRASDVLTYARHPKIIPKFGMDHRVSMGFGLNLGWAIEGAIGSEYKIDASYLSPHVNMAAQLQQASRLYGVDMLFSHAIHQAISSKIAEKCRNLDVVTMKEHSTQQPIYTFDTKDEGEPVGVPEGHEVGHVIPPAEMTAESLKAKGAEFCISLDLDLANIQEGISFDFQSSWKQALRLYIRGNWEQAADGFERCNAMRKFGDPPAECILNFLESHQMKAPEDWKGSRVLQ